MSDATTDGDALVWMAILDGEAVVIQGEAQATRRSAHLG